MYSRAVGILNEKKESLGVESFNKSIREQYKRKALSKPSENSEKPNVTDEKKKEVQLLDKAQDALSSFQGIDFDSILVIGLILILITQAETPDLILLGALASVIF